MKKVFLASFITILSVSAILAGFYYYQKLKSEKSQVLDAIPSDVALILQTSDLGNTIKNLEATGYWNDFSSNSIVLDANMHLQVLDSLVKANQDLAELMKKQTLTLSVHPSGFGDPKYLILFNIPQVNPEQYVDKLVNEVVKDKVPIARRSFEGSLISEISFNHLGKRELFSYTVVNGLFLGSFSGSLLEASVRLAKVPGRPSPGLKKVIDAAGSNVDISLYINSRNFPLLFRKYINRDYANALETLGKFSLWSEMDIKLGKNELNFTGITTIDSSESFLSCFKDQQPQSISVTSVMPYTVSSMIYWGMSDFDQFYRNYAHFVRNNLNKNFSGDNRSIRSWVGQEVSFVSVQPNDSVYEDNYYILLHTPDTLRAKRDLLKDMQSYSTDTLQPYYNFQIGRIKDQDYLKRIFGPICEKIQQPYFTIAGNYVIFSQSLTAMHGYLEEVHQSHVLSREAGYQQLSVNISSRANFYFYLNFSRSEDLQKTFGSDSLRRLMESSRNGLAKYNALAVQFIADGKIGAFFNQVCLQKIVQNSSGTDVEKEWELNLDTVVSMAPQFVKNHITGEQEIIVQDDANRIYLVNMDGEILWSRKMPSRIVGKVHQVDAFRNKHLQFLFNTRTGLHLLDRNGENVQGFPVKFNNPATCGLSVFDYDSTGDYRVFTCHQNGQVAAFTIEGKPVQGWGFNKPIWPVVNPVQYFKVKDKDYLLVSDSKGVTYILNRKGEKIAIADKPVYRSKYNSWMVDVLDQPYFITTDSTGNIYNLYQDGHTEVIHYKGFSPGHFFRFMDVNQDNLRDYIFLDKGNLEVTNQDTSKIISLKLQTGSKGKEDLEIYRDVEKNLMFIAVSEKDNQVYAISKDGEIKAGFPVEGSTPPGLLAFSRNGKFKTKDFMVCGSHNKLFLYSLK